MNKSLIALTVAVFGLILACHSMLGSEALRLYDLKHQRELDPVASLERLAEARVILVGEHHAVTSHHRAQLEVIRTLVEGGKKVAVGLEMFRRESQGDLDRWIGGLIQEADFKPIYLDNWNFDWELYRPIFRYARQQGLPMIGLNVDRGVTRQVAYHGFASLSEDQKAALGAVTCDVTPPYRDYIRQAYDAHVHGKMQFDNFCEAQLLWDTAMAVNAAQYLQANADTVLVILAGVGHAQKPGIPAQLAKRAPWPYLVLLPETPGSLDTDRVDSDAADYLIKPSSRF
jgi:uncharacterized iron-regulated protein